MKMWNPLNEKAIAWLRDHRKTFIGIGFGFLVGVVFTLLFLQ